MRSLLIAPAEEKRLAEALESGADAVIVDLAATAPAERAGARAAAARFLKEARGRRGGPLLIVRANALDSGETDADLDAVMAGAPDAILLPGSLGARERPTAFGQTCGARGRSRARRRRDPDHRRRRYGAGSVQHGKLSRLERAAHRASPGAPESLRADIGGRDGPRPPRRIISAPIAWRAS